VHDEPCDIQEQGFVVQFVLHPQLNTGNNKITEQSYKGSQNSYVYRQRLLDQGYEKIRLIRSPKKFIFRYHDLVEIYSFSAEKIINDGFSYSENV
jgi:hypothetical protein